MPEIPDHISPESENERPNAPYSQSDSLETTNINSAVDAKTNDPASTDTAKKFTRAAKAGTESDRLLFEKIAASDEAAFEAIFDKYTAILYPFILDQVKIEADAREIIQDIFLKLWLNKESLAKVENPGGYLYKMAANEARSHFRKESRYARRLQKIAADDPSQYENLADIHDEFDAKEIKTLIAEAVKQLPTRRRQIFQMARLEGYSRKEIAETLGISENTVRNQLTDAVEFIQDYITKNRALYLPALLIGLLGGLQ